jgi:hypothetical protein
MIKVKNKKLIILAILILFVGLGFYLYTMDSSACFILRVKERAFFSSTCHASVNPMDSTELIVGFRTEPTKLAPIAQVTLYTVSRKTKVILGEAVSN